MAKTLYDLLNIPESATERQVHHSFKQIERLYETRKDSESIAALNRIREAFLILSDSSRRMAYDRKLALRRLPYIPAPAVVHQHPDTPWLQRIIVVLLLLFPIASWFYHENSYKQLSSDTAKLVDLKLQATSEALIAEQEQWLKGNQPAQSTSNDTSASQRFAAELQIKQQQLDDVKSLNQQQLNNEARDLDLHAKQLEMASQAQQLGLADRRIDMQYQQPAMKLDLQVQQDQHNEQVRQRALQQRDQNIASIHDLRAARLRAYDRDHGNGDISRSNPALDP